MFSLMCAFVASSTRLLKAVMQQRRAGSECLRAPCVHQTLHTPQPALTASQGLEGLLWPHVAV